MKNEFTHPASNIKKLLLVKVGNNERPAGDADIKDIEEQLKAALASDGVLVTHHLVEIQVIHLD